MLRKFIVTDLIRVLLWLLLPAVVTAMQLPPQIQTDRYFLQAERAIDEQDFLRAKTAMDAMLELQVQHDLELPEQFSFRYAEVLDRLGLYDEAIKYVTEYLTVAGRDGKYYREALELLDSAEETSRRVQAERELAEAAQRQAEAEKREIDEQVQRQVEEAGIALPPDELRSGGIGPEMVRIASGRFQYYTWQDHGTNIYGVEFDEPFAISKYEVTRGEFERFVEHSRYRTEAEQDPGYGCHDGPYAWNPTRRKRLRWNRPGFDQTDGHPVTCVSIQDVIAYAQWLSLETGHTYRLPSAAEWQYVARAGSTAAMLYEEYSERADRDDSNACRYGNVQDSSTDDGSGDFFGYKCYDGAPHTAEVGRFPPNGVGIHDMRGNVSELVLACYDSYLRPNGSPDVPSSCDDVAALGASWYSHYVDGYDYRATALIPARAHRDGEWYVLSSSTWAGFRVVRELDDAPVAR